MSAGMPGTRTNATSSGVQLDAGTNRWGAQRTSLILLGSHTWSELTMGFDMILLGLLLLIVGLLVGMSLLTTVGGILIVVGAILWILGATGRAVGGRKHFF
ncbi:hypothetical protein [Streptomyces sp. CB02115]|uniref:hypothetical protein n=3 Tax=Streptomyces TaxID=1883 RepID=UPI0018E99632|nr:hypothetical protein [Streptomyces sp. CB02115]